MNTKFGSYYISPLSLRYMYKYFKLLRWRYNRGNRGIQGFRRRLESIVFTIAPPANLPVANSVVFAPLACTIVFRYGVRNLESPYLFKLSHLWISLLRHIYLLVLQSYKSAIKYITMI